MDLPSSAAALVSCVEALTCSADAEDSSATAATALGTAADGLASSPKHGKLEVEPRADTSDAQHAWLSSLAPVTASRRLEQLEKAIGKIKEMLVRRAV